MLDGDPVSRCKVLFSSADGCASTVIWDCTAGRFNWFYACDETVCVLEGDVIVTDQRGVARRVTAGGKVYFPAGSRAEWYVESYVRKVAFLRTPLPRPVQFAYKFMRRLKRIATFDAREASVPAVMQNSLDGGFDE